MRNLAEIRDHEIVLGMKVVGTAGEHTEEVYCLDMNVAFAQNNTFRRAGYRDVMLIPTYFVFDDERKCYPVKMGEPIDLLQETVPARYSRADIYPGMNVYEYDKKVLNRTIQRYQVAGALLISMVLVIGTLVMASLAGMAIGAILGRLYAAIGTSFGFFGSMVVMIVCQRRKHDVLDYYVQAGFWVMGVPPCMR